MDFGNIMGTLGPWIVLIVVGLWLFIMMKFQRWRITQIIGGMLLMAALYGNFPTLPATLNNAMTGVAHSFGIK